MKLPRSRGVGTPTLSSGATRPSKKIFSWGETAYDGVAFGRNG